MPAAARPRTFGAAIPSHETAPTFSFDWSCTPWNMIRPSHAPTSCNGSRRRRSRSVRSLRCQPQPPQLLRSLRRPLPTKRNRTQAINAPVVVSSHRPRLARSSKERSRRTVGANSTRRKHRRSSVSPRAFAPGARLRQRRSRAESRASERGVSPDWYRNANSLVQA